MKSISILLMLLLSACASSSFPGERDIRAEVKRNSRGAPVTTCPTGKDKCVVVTITIE